MRVRKRLRREASGGKDRENTSCLEYLSSEEEVLRMKETSLRSNRSKRRRQN
jgi:hypothetical protein